MKVELAAEGEIYYAFGDKVPTTDSERYEKALSLEKTTVLRAIAVEEGALPSRQTVFNYIINENHTLPVASLVADDRKEFVWMYSNGNKLKELPATLSLYEEDGGGFTVACGVRMHGETSLTLEKKNMSIRFRSAYGPDMLHYDIYDGGIDSFRNLVLRAGQDYYAAIIKNAAAQNLCLQAGNRTITGRSKFCILYVNGEYLGWHSRNLRLVRCRIGGTQPLCYADGLVLEDCTFEPDADLAFEYSDVQATVRGHVVSIKNPRTGSIRADSCGELILDSNIKAPADCRIEIGGKLIQGL